MRAFDWDPIRAEHYGQRLHRSVDVRFTPESGHSAAQIRRDGFPSKYDLSEGARAEMLACAEPNLE
jgi:hypothetical protein